MELHKLFQQRQRAGKDKLGLKGLTHKRRKEAECDLEAAAESDEQEQDRAQLTSYLYVGCTTTID